MPECIVNSNAFVDEVTIINSVSILEHGWFIGKFNYIAPGDVLSGSVRTEDYVHISNDVRIVKSVSIVENSLIGAGSTVTKKYWE